MAAIRAKDSSQLKEQSTDEKYRDMKEKYDDLEADKQADGNKYHAMKQRLMRARSNMIMAKAVAKKSKENLLRLNQNMSSMRKKAAAQVRTFASSSVPSRARISTKAMWTRSPTPSRQ